MKYKLIIDKHAEEEITVVAHGPSSLTQQIEDLVCRASGADNLLGYREDEIRKLADEMNVAEQVLFTGVRKDIDKLYSVMDVFCLPSYYEGMPVVAWEALCNGLPCIFSDQVTTEAAISQNAMFLPLDRPEQWVDGIVNAQRETVDEMDQIDIHYHARKLERLYEEAECK